MPRPSIPSLATPTIVFFKTNAYFATSMTATGNAENDGGGQAFFAPDQVAGHVPLGGQKRS